MDNMFPGRLCLVLLLATMSQADNDADWSKQCNKCKCVWSSGKKIADCTGLGLNSIPTDLSEHIREFDFSFNPLYDLGVKIFEKANIRDAHKMRFQNCSIESVDKFAFGGLCLLIELDLSRNSIKKIDRITFRDNLKLRVVNLGFNNLTKLENGLFFNMTHLQKVIVNNNQIANLGHSVFGQLPALQFINLANNKLKRINYDFTRELKKLSSISVEGNPWICDCHLEEFRRKSVHENWITTPTKCEEPARVKGKQWADHEVTFACLPSIMEPLASSSIEAITPKIVLTCKVTGEPQPEVDWIFNGRILPKDAKQSNHKYAMDRETNGNVTWNNLTIANVNVRDRGEYWCQAQNPGGSDKKNITLMISGELRVSADSSQSIGAVLPIVISVCVAVVIMIIVIIVLLCRCRKTRTDHLANGKHHDNESSSEYINLHGHHPDMEKALITEVNPVMKPPRIVPPSSIISGGTEVSDVKRQLLDSDSVYTGDDESRSIDYSLQPFRKSQNLIDTDYDSIHQYPPDLLAFSHRISQVSPAGSSASTVVDTSRLPQSPLHSPLYDQIYRTLPHSRSQSPFVGVTARVPRQGYVTIPRRPRQSWSSEPPEICEPLYDNLGIRTTAQGHSTTSLNKIDSASITPKSNRLPMTPTVCDTIVEDTSPPQTQTSKTLPRNLHSQGLSPASRTNWARANAEALRSPDKRNSISSLPPSSPDHKTTKIPPRPPPKPKKKLQTGPLFEDEGEDGTEV